jgi:hypothetical protein
MLNVYVEYVEVEYVMEVENPSEVSEYNEAM